LSAHYEKECTRNETVKSVTWYPILYFLVVIVEREVLNAPTALPKIRKNIATVNAVDHY